jgi:hypothetical protein
MNGKNKKVKPTRTSPRAKKSVSGNRTFSVIVLVALSLILLVVLSRTDLLSTISNAAEKNPWKHSSILLKEKKIKAAEKILQISLSYDAQAAQTLRVTEFQQKNGYVPQQTPDSHDYRIVLLDANNSVLASQTFTIPNTVEDPPPLPGEKAEHSGATLDKVDFALTLPWHEAATKVTIYNQAGAVVTTQNITSLEKKNNTPNFHSVTGDELTKKPDNAVIGFIKNLIRKTQAASTDGQYVDILFIGDDFTTEQLELFHSDVTNFATHQQTYEPYASRGSQIRYSYVDNTTDLGCAHDDQTIRLIVCDSRKVTDAVNSAGAPYDSIVVIVNDDAYGGSGGTIAVSYNGLWGKQVFVHEFGHSFGRLRDEYLVSSSNNVVDGNAYANCLAGTPPAEEWEGVVAPSDYYLKCSYPNWYRSSFDSIMNHLEAEYFNPISQKLINQRIDLFAGPIITPTPTPDPLATPTMTPEPPTPTMTPVPDTVSPTVTITAPLNNATVKRNTTVTITANSTDNLGVSSVQYFVNNISVCTDSTAPYTCSWRVPNQKNATYTLRATASDAANNSSSHSIQVKAQ